MQIQIELARSDLTSAKALYELFDYRGSNNRAYYSIFHCINAVHALDEHSYKKHKEALANFNKDYPSLKCLCVLRISS